MKRWEYKIVHLYTSIATLEQCLNDMGMDGWEYVRHTEPIPMVGTEVMFKREIYVT